MNGFGQAVWVELLKARRSPVPLFTALGFSMIPLVGGLFMVILRDPELARRMGLISVKAQILTGAADWQTYLGFLAMATAVGGFLLFSFIGSWVFGREFSDRTAKDILALPTSRSSIVLAKFVVIALWSAVLVLLIIALGFVIGYAVDLPPATAQVISQGTLTLVVTAGLTIALETPVTFFASEGHGYLPPLGFTALLVALAQVIAVLGYGEFFPWSIPALYADISGDLAISNAGMSFAIVGITGLAGLIATLLWWELADQTY
jgi:ABC-2 type transport system permease protein